jgi:hypothetical protein
MAKHMHKKPRSPMNAKWALICDAAFFDITGRLCITGINCRLNFPQLPLTVRDLVIVVAFDGGAPDRLRVRLKDLVTMPSGQQGGPNPDKMIIETSKDYLLIHLRDIPMTDEGVYRTVVSMDGEPFASVELPVLVGATDGPVN